MHIMSRRHVLMTSFGTEMSLQKCVTAPHVASNATKSAMGNALMVHPQVVVVQPRYVGICQ